VHQYPFWEILGWWLDGLWRHVAATINFTWLLPKNESPPGFWYIYFSWWDWDWNTDDKGRVNSTITRNWMWACQRLWENWINEVGNIAQDLALTAVRGWTGYVIYGYVTFRQWIDAIAGRVGSWVPSFAYNLADACYRLWQWLPEDIRSGVASWYSKFLGWYDSVVAWAQSTYDQAKIWATSAWAWICATGASLKSWWDTAHWWLDDFRQNAVARIVGWLGTTWARAVLFFAHAGTFWYDLWGSYAVEIGEFWDNPLMWLYDRAEDELCKRW